MKWFKHQTSALTNSKLTKLRMKFGSDGYAVYWHCLELIASELGTSDKVTFTLKHDSEVIGFYFGIDSRRVEDIMRYMVELGLFEERDGTVSCLKLAKYIDKKTTRNKRIHQIVDSAQSIGALSATVPDASPTNRDSPPTVPEQSPDCPDLSGLDTDTDTDTEIKDSSSEKISDAGVDGQKSDRVEDREEPDKPPKFTDDDLTTAEYIHKRVLRIVPDFKPPNLRAWADDVRLMRERDGRDHRRICEVFKWANDDSFWQANVLSPRKLREQFDQLAAKMQGRHGHGTDTSGNNGKRGFAEPSAGGFETIIPENAPEFLRE